MSPATLDQLSAALPNGLAPLDGVLTAGQPGAGQLATLAQAGVRTVLDLRAPMEPRGYDEAAAVRAAGMEYVNVPVVPGLLGDAEFDEVRRVLRDDARRPALVHCVSANRVGAALIPYLVLDEGREPADALRLAQEVGLVSEDLARTALDYVRRHRGR